MVKIEIQPELNRTLDLDLFQAIKLKVEKIQQTKSPCKLYIYHIQELEATEYLQKTI